MDLAGHAAGGREIFIRNLAFDVKAEDIEQLCSDIGPVKRASIIQGKEGRSRGFGFVIFAVPDDAERSVATLDGSQYRGRVLSVEVAMKKGQRPVGVCPSVKVGRTGHKPTGSTPSHVESEAEGMTRHSERMPGNGSDPASHGVHPIGSERRTPARKPPLLVEDPKTLLVFNLAEQTTQKQFFKRVKKVEHPKLLRFENLGNSKVAVIGLETTAAARKLQKKLDGHVVHGCKLAVRRLRTLPPRALKQRHQEQGIEEVGLNAMRGFAKREARVIVRNLSFQATSQDLKDALSIFGPVMGAEVPTITVNGVQEKRGFGFVTFIYSEDAARAVATAEPVKVRGREVAIDLCLGRQEYEIKKQDAKASRSGEAAGTTCEDEAKTQGIVLQESHKLIRSASPDTTVRNGTEQDGKLESENTEDDEDDEEDEDEQDDEEDEDEQDDEKDDEEGGAETSDGSQRDDDEKEPEKDTRGTKVLDKRTICSERGGVDKSQSTTQKCDASEGKTIFVRNVPFDATNDALKEAFATSTGQSVAFAAIVKDRATGLSKGTAFVKFKSRQGIDAVLTASMAEGDGCLSLLGRRLKVDKAVDRALAPLPATGGTNGRLEGKVDRRYLYLANEGLVLPRQVADNDQAPHADLEKRRREQEEKKSKLRNPLFFVNPSRLSIRNLSKSISDAELRRALSEGARMGIEEGKVTVDDVRLHLQAGAQVVPPDIQVPSAAKASVRKVKVMRDLDKKPLDGVYQSRGYAFAEFTNHAYALAALRHINNNPAYSRLAQGGASKGKGSVARLIVSFAVEDHRMLKKKELRIRRAEAVMVSTKVGSPRPPAKSIKRGREDMELEAEDKAIEFSPKKVKLSRGQRQREKRRSGGGDPGHPQDSKEAKSSTFGGWGAKGIRKGGMVQPQSFVRHVDDQRNQQLIAAGTSRGQRGGKAEVDEDSKFSSIVSQYKKRIFQKPWVHKEGVVGMAEPVRSNRWFEGL